MVRGVLVVLRKLGLSNLECHQVAFQFDSHNPPYAVNLLDPEESVIGKGDFERTGVSESKRNLEKFFVFPGSQNPVMGDVLNRATHPVSA